MMQVLNSLREIALFLQQPNLALRWRVALGSTFSIWWHHVWWLVISLMLVRIGVLSYVTPEDLSPLMYDVLNALELCAWLVVYFVLHASLYVTLYPDDEREYTLWHYGKLLLFAAIPLIVCRTISTLVFYASPIVSYLITIVLAPFGIGINAAISAMFTFFMLELFASDHSMLAALRSWTRACKMVVYAYPFLVVSHMIAIIGFWLIAFAVGSVIQRIFMVVCCNRLVPSTLKSSITNLRNALQDAPWQVFACPFLVSWFGVFFQFQRNQDND